MVCCSSILEVHEITVSLSDVQCRWSKSYSTPHFPKQDIKTNKTVKRNCHDRSLQLSPNRCTYLWCPFLFFKTYTCAVLCCPLCSSLLGGLFQFLKGKCRSSLTSHGKCLLFEDSPGLESHLLHWLSLASYQTQLNFSFLLFEGTLKGCHKIKWHEVCK